MIRCLLKLFDRNPNINKSIDASVYLAIRANNLLNADADTIEEYKEDIRDMGFSLSNLYGKSTQYYANFCKTEDFFYNNFRSILAEFFKVHNIDYETVDFDIRLLKEYQIRRIASGNVVCIKNIFTKLYPPEYYLQCMFSSDINNIAIENCMNFLANCKMSMLYIKNIDTKKYRDFLKIYSDEESMKRIEKNEKITMVYRMLPSYTPKDLFSLLHDLQLYF